MLQLGGKRWQGSERAQGWPCGINLSNVKKFLQAMKTLSLGCSLTSFSILKDPKALGKRADGCEMQKYENKVIQYRTIHIIYYKRVKMKQDRCNSLFKPIVRQFPWVKYPSRLCLCKAVIKITTCAWGCDNLNLPDLQMCAQISMLDEMCSEGEWFVLSVDGAFVFHNLAVQSTFRAGAFNGINDPFYQWFCYGSP